MKAVIIKTNNNKAVALQENGVFINIPNKDYIIGQEIYTGHSIKRHKSLRIMIASAAIILVMFVIGMVYAYNTPKSYVSLDINPSIELKMNIFNDVISAKGINSDGELILNQIKVKNMDYEQAIEMIVLQAKTDGYLNQYDEKTIFVAVNSSRNNRTYNIKINAEKVVEDTLCDVQVKAKVQVKIVDDETIEKAKIKCTTAGKLNLIEKYKEVSSDDTSIDELLNKSVQELLVSIENNEDNNKGNNDKDKKDKPFDNQETVNEDGNNTDDTDTAITSDDNKNDKANDMSQGNGNNKDKSEENDNASDKDEDDDNSDEYSNDETVDDDTDKKDNNIDKKDTNDKDDNANSNDNVQKDKEKDKQKDKDNN